MPPCAHLYPALSFSSRFPSCYVRSLSLGSFLLLVCSITLASPSPRNPASLLSLNGGAMTINNARTDLGRDSPSPHLTPSLHVAAGAFFLAHKKLTLEPLSMLHHPPATPSIRLGGGNKTSPQACLSRAHTTFSTTKRTLWT